MKLIHILAAAALATALTANAQSSAASAADHAAHHPAAASPQSDGEVRKVDKEQGKITLKHGEIRNIDMPPMTMVFRVQDPAMLDRVKEGDKVGFTADKIGGQFTVTSLEKK